NDLIQGTENTSCIDATPMLNWALSAPSGRGRAIQTVITNTATVINSVNQRMPPLASRGKNASTSAPSAGRKVTRLSGRMYGLSIEQNQLSVVRCPLHGELQF